MVTELVSRVRKNEKKGETTVRKSLLAILLFVAPHGLAERALAKA